MTGSTQGFDKLHEDTVRQFLSGVVIIDDQIDYCERCSSKEGSSAKPKTQIPVKSPTSQQFGPTPKDESPSEKSDVASEPDLNMIYSPDMVRAFADEGISCVTQKWEGNPSDPDIELPKLCSKVDVVVFDWELDEVNDYKALPLIKKLVEKTENAFQYIVIYTSQKDHESIISEIKGGFSQTPITDQGKILDYALPDGNVATHRIEIIEKYADDKKFCAQLIKGFSTFSQGFLRRSALSAITAIRNNTFKIISLYPSHLDKAYLSHLTGILSSKEMFHVADIALHDYTVTLLSNAIYDSLMYSEVLKESLDKNSISKYISENSDVSIFVSGYKKYDASNVKIKELVECPSHKKLSQKLFSLHVPSNRRTGGDEENNFSNNLNAFYIETDEDKLHEFSALDCCTHRFMFSTKTTHPLKFGTVLQEVESGRYFLCLQPLCDSIRLKGMSTFPFVELVEESTKPVYILPQPGGKILKLKACKNPHQNLHSYKFLPNKDSSDVRCDENLNFEEFKKNKESKKMSFKWIGELRLHHTQELAHSIANQGTRIGADKFEWLRINTK